MFDPLFDEAVVDEEGDECPSCGVIPSIDGFTPGCDDPNGCGLGARDEDDEEFFEEEDDDALEELDFE